MIIVDRQIETLHLNNKTTVFGMFFIKLIVAGIMIIASLNYYAEDTAKKNTESNSALSFSTSTSFINAPPLFLNYRQKDIDTLEVAYRLSQYNKKPKAVLKAGEQKLSSITKKSYPKKGDVTAILFLIDISDPRRQRIIKKNINQIIAVIKSSKKHHKFGLASFAEDMQILAPLGSSKENVINKAKALKATGSETLLYQYIGEAIAQLNKYKATRRVLIVFSDGKAEDNQNVYNHEYIIKKTVEKNIIINGMAFPSKPKKNNISYYQTLERLASETGGVFLKATPAGDIKSDKLLKLLSKTDTGGYWKFDLQALNTGNLSGKIKAILNVSFAQETKEVPINFVLPEKQKADAIAPDRSKLLLIGLPLSFLLALLLFFFVRKKKSSATYAVIESIDGNKKYIIDNKTYKIGRNEENNLVLENQTVSSFHVQIHLNRDKEFIISDLQSANGVLINNEKITNIALKNNDLIEIGEVRLRFLTETNLN